jgi:phosphohistidine phosphatase
MLRLILLRHAQAAQHAGGGDSERALTMAGRAEARLMGDYIASEHLTPDLAVVSIAKRARETFKLAMEVAGVQPRVLEEPRLYLAEPPALLDLMHMTPSSVRRLLCVGHNPGFHDYALQMIASGAKDARAHLQLGLPTAGLIVIDFDEVRWEDVAVGSGKLDRFVTPDDLR